jgi:SAM-dependent MidA family methyltransferase
MRVNDTGTLAPREPAPRRDVEGHAAAHGARVREHLRAAIAAAGGWLSFARYMDLALYAPGLGYYSAGAAKIGSGGDFTTAPEISPLFGACVARQCAEILAHIPNATLLEIGAGTGRLAVDLLARLERLGSLPARYRILEVSADLAARQREHLAEHLPHLLARVDWLAVPPTESFAGIIVANEVLDALPVERFRWSAAHIEELGVAADAAGFHWAARPASAPLTAACRRLAAAAGPWDEGYVSEYCPSLRAWTATVTRALMQGAVLWFDYGLPRAQYYLPERHEGTLMCHFQHRTETDPFRHPGLHDITAWVDFTALAEAGRAAGFEVAGFTTQTYFLAATGIDAEMREAAAGDPRREAVLAQQARRLMMPGEMGERFKAMAWLRGLEVELAGFGMRDLRHTL